MSEEGAGSAAAAEADASSPESLRLARESARRVTELVDPPTR
ncbi:hypothetical protein [Nocardiopsis exhalans]|nr:hypothetical protein [Nocardiopsis exhalans]